MPELNNPDSDEPDDYELCWQRFCELLPELSVEEVVPKFIHLLWDYGLLKKFEWSCHSSWIGGQE